MKVRDIMTADPEVLDADASVEEAAQLLSDADIGSAPVIDAGRAIGIVTDRDIVVRGAAEGLPLAETKVVDVMTPETISCFDDDEVETAARLMADRQVRRLLVLDREGGLAGIVSLADLATETSRASEVLESVSRPGSELDGLGVHTSGAASGSAGSDMTGLTPLVRGEIAAVETYKQALDKVGARTRTGAELLRIEAEHEDAVALLRETLEARGGAAPADSGLWGAWARAVEGASASFGGRAALSALREGEEHGVHDYEEALRDEALGSEVKALIRDTLLPRTRAHIPALERALREPEGG